MITRLSLRGIKADGLLALTFFLSSVTLADDYLLVPRTKMDSNYHYHASPAGWRDINIYQLFTDRFYDGDRSNNKTDALGIQREGWFHHNGTITDGDRSPENLVGQFKGPDDLATKRQDVQHELDLAFKNLISATDCDGFRVDAIKHIEYEWCKKWADDMRKHAASLNKNNFILFGELFSYDNNALASFCKDEGYSFNSALFFPMSSTIKNVFKGGSSTGQLTAERNNMAQYGEGTDRLVAFIDNHDVNRIALEMEGDYSDDVARLKPAITFSTQPCARSSIQVQPSDAF